MTKDLKLIKYQLRYLERQFTYSQFILASNKDGSFQIKSKKSKIDRHTIGTAILGLGLFTVNYINDYHPFLYFLSAVFLGLVLLAWTIGPTREKHQHFAFNRTDKVIEYNTSLRNIRKKVSTKSGASIRCEIDTFRSNRGHFNYSATFYARLEGTRKNDIIFQINSENKRDCEVISKALIRYLVTMSDLKKIPFIEKKSGLPGHR